VNKRQRLKAERDAMRNIMQAYLCLKDPSERNAFGHARALCLDAVDLLEIALGIDDESQALRLWDKRFRDTSSG